MANANQFKIDVSTMKYASTSTKNVSREDHKIRKGIDSIS
jgi:hypothetical protein